MDSSKPNSVGSEDARDRTRCRECRRPLTPREEFIGETCIECERDYLHDTHAEDDYPRAA